MEEGGPSKRTALRLLGGRREGNVRCTYDVDTSMGRGSWGGFGVVAGNARVVATLVTELGSGSWCAAQRVERASGVGGMARSKFRFKKEAVKSVFVLKFGLVSI